MSAPVYRVFKDYGCEGWRHVGDRDCGTVLEAVLMREDALASMGGGDVIIVEVLDLFEAYRRAGEERK